MTYRGHRVSKTLLRAKFSPLEQTGQRFIYTGCATGRIISKYHICVSLFIIYSFSFCVVYDVLTGRIREAIEGHRNVIRDLDWHPVRSEIVSSSVRKYNISTLYRHLIIFPMYSGILMLT